MTQPSLKVLIVDDYDIDVIHTLLNSYADQCGGLDPEDAALLDTVNRAIPLADAPQAVAQAIAAQNRKADSDV